jgi:hypothetical protein
MSVESLTVTLDGEVSLENFAKAIDGFLGIVNALSADAMPGHSVDWVLDDLEFGSAIVSVRPRQSVSTEVLIVIATQFLGLGTALNLGQPGQFSQDAFRSGQKLLSAASAGVRFETPESEVVVMPGQLVRYAEARPQVRHSLGSIRGTVQTLSRRKGVRFTVYDVMFDKPVSCYLALGQEDMIKNYWGQRVSVSGRISRDGVTGIPLAVRSITSISLSEPSEPGSWRKASGVLKGVFEKTPEVLVRELRDA